MAERLEGGDACGALEEAKALQADTIAAVNDRRIPQPFQEELTGSVAALVDSIECAPASAPEDEDGDAPATTEDAGRDEDEDHDDDGGNGKGKGKGKKKGKDKD